MSGFGDYLDIVGLQTDTGTSGLVSPAVSNRICGGIWALSKTSHGTLCSFAVPFKVGVHFDADDAICPATSASPASLLNLCENDSSSAPPSVSYGYSGFYLAYWQNTC